MMRKTEEWSMFKKDKVKLALRLYFGEKVDSGVLREAEDGAEWGSEIGKIAALIRQIGAEQACFKRDFKLQVNARLTLHVDNL